MPQGPAPASPGRGEDPARLPREPVPTPDRMTEPVHTPDWMTGEDWQAWCDSQVGQDEPPDPDEEEPDSAASWEYDLEQIAAECRQVTADEAAACARARRLGMPGGSFVGLERRGPGQPGSARRARGEYLSRAAGFATGMLLDTMPGCNALAGFAAEAAGDDDTYEGASDDEVAGVICAWDRLEAHMAARKHAAIAEFIRRRPEPGCSPAGPARLPGSWDEFTVDEFRHILAESRGAVEDMLSLARDLEEKLPGTKEAFRDGILRLSKVETIARATAVLDPEEARKAEAMVLGRAGRLTPAGLRAAIARAVMEVAPEKARKRREEAARDARVERWAEDSGNAALMGRELPSVEVLAADQKITAWARQLKKAGLEGSLDELRARAYLDLLLGQDSRPGQHARNAADGKPDAEGGQARGGDGGRKPAGSVVPTPGGPRAGVIPAGFAGRVTLTIPLATLLGRADRPGEMAGIGPVDPWLARDLARAAARNPRSTWCVTVTDEQGHAIGHGCARPQGGHDPPVRTRDGPGFTFTATGGAGPPGGYGRWRLSTGTAGQRDLIVPLDPIATEDCDHRFAARGHDPGVKLRHLAQVRYATCTGPTCRRPSTQADFEHNIPYETGGRTCLCNGSPKCRHDHRLKQHSRWKVEQLPTGEFRWTTPSGRQSITEPTRYPV